MPGDSDWEGKQKARQSDRIGLLLDLDQGSMTVWKNDVRLGAMQAEGLSGPLCWAASLAAVAGGDVNVPPGHQRPHRVGATAQRRNGETLYQQGGASAGPCVCIESGPGMCNKP